MIPFQPGFLTTKKREFLCFKELNISLSRWANEMKNSGVITATMAKEKAAELASAMGHNLIPSTAWLYKWKERENIQFAKRKKDAEVLKLLLVEKEKNELLQRVHDNITKKNKNKLNPDKNICNNPTLANQCPSGNAVESKKKTRPKRNYVRRMNLKGRSRKERTLLTLLQKYEIIQRLKNGESKNDLLVEYNLSQSAMCQIITDKKRILKVAAGGQNLLMMRIRGGKFKDGESELNTWVREKLKNGESLTRNEIKNRAKKIAERLNIDFKASEGWLQKWKARMNLDFNEHQKLERKVPPYIPTHEEFQNSKAPPEQSDSLYEQQCNEMPDVAIKEEIDCAYNNQMQDVKSNDDFIYNDVDVKPELLTPQQFYLQTICADSPNICNDSQSKNQWKEENHKSTEEPEVTTIVDTSLHVPINEDITSSPENLYVKVELWLSRYNIDPEAASELRNILQPYLKSETKNLSKPF